MTYPDQLNRIWKPFRQPVHAFVELIDGEESLIIGYILYELNNVFVIQILNIQILVQVFEF